MRLHRLLPSSVLSILSILSLLLAACTGGTEEESAAPPLAGARPVVDRYWGVDVVDDYRYMEEMSDPEVVSWMEANDRYTRDWLQAFSRRGEVKARVGSIIRSDSPDYYGITHRGETLFAMVRRPPKQQPFLAALHSLSDPEALRILVDPNEIDPAGHTSIDFYVPSHNGRFVAVSLSKGGTEDGTLSIYDVGSGARLSDEIPRVNGGTAGGSVAWNETSDGLYYTRYPSPGERPDEDLPFYQQIWFHKIGTEIAEDHYVLGESFPRIAEIDLTASRDGRHTIARVSYGDGGEHEYWLRGPRAEWTRFAEFDDGVERAAFGADGMIYLLSRKDAPHRQVLRLDPADPDWASAHIVVPESEGVITTFRRTENRIYVVEMLGGPSWLEVYDGNGASLETVGGEEISSITGLVDIGGDEILFRRESYLAPPAWYEYGPGMKSGRATALVMTSPADYSECEVRRLFAVAEDGVEIPVNLIMKKGALEKGASPTILYGYGCYGYGVRPRFRDYRLLWIEQGGIYAEAGIRGGGEYGDEWHQAARLGKKKRSIDDFAACARHLVAEGITTRDLLAAEGGSAGGLLVYGAMVHDPDRMGAVVSHVGFGDMIRSEFSPNGQFNVTEFGTVKDSVQFAGMYAYSPYHHVRDGTVYPAVLSLTGINDPRVEAWHPFKMTARIQASGTPNPVLLRVERDAGHGAGSLDQREEALADVYSFLFRWMNLEYKPVS